MFSSCFKKINDIAMPKDAIGEISCWLARSRAEATEDANI